MDEDEALLDHFVEDFNRHHWDCDGCAPPFFALPPPPRPPFLEADEDLCAPDTSPYETCDNPIIIDSHFHTSNEMLNILLIVIFAFLLVGIILVIAFIIWRKRVNLFNTFRGKNGSSSSSTLQVDHDHLHGGHQMGFQKSDFPFFSPHHQPQTKPTNAIELSEQPLPTAAPSSTNRHVYSNPNYPTLEIGGLPFYLMPAGDVPPHMARGTLGSPALPLSKDTSLTSPVGGGGAGIRSFSIPSQNHHESASVIPPSHFSASGQSPQIGENHFYEPSGSSATSSRGPIYEDIDRMCSYRGAPPVVGFLSQRMEPVNHRLEDDEDDRPVSLDSSVAPLRNNTISDPLERTYCNVMPSKSPSKRSGSRPDSSGSTSSPVPCGTSSSEVSFDSGSSPRHPGNILVNPMSPQALARVRGFSPTTASQSERTRSPNSVYAAKLASQSKSPGGKSSLYYYSDTLRPRTNRGFQDSDSGISNNRSTCEDTPPPPPLPSQRLAQMPSP
eukprot:maker-scaffold349_size200065-snap-gene-1.19 protein:Tk10539 transcript:maker-scaffold349_size200065-snap-gene-1.19-mRNA-1 annotation:"hypothetical protein KGM_06566"